MLSIFKPGLMRIIATSALGYYHSPILKASLLQPKNPEKGMNKSGVKGAGKKPPAGGSKGKGKKNSWGKLNKQGSKKSIS